MNAKHLAVFILLLAGLGFVQIGLTFQKGVEAIKAQIVETEAKQTELDTQVSSIEQGIAQSQNQARRLLEFAKTWEPYFDRMADQRTAEARFRQELRDSRLVNLSQLFQKADNKSGENQGVAIPSVTVATVTFEDNYVRLLNWLGTIEEKYPTLRVKKLDIKKGSRIGDLQMELSVEIPLKAPSVTE